MRGAPISTLAEFMTMTANEKVLTRVDGHVLHVTINRPERYNAIDSETNFALEAAMSRFAADDELWLAVIRGAGDKAFVAGYADQRPKGIKPNQIVLIRLHQLANLALSCFAGL